MDAITQLVMQAVASPWIYAIVFALVVIDGFFPPVPSETLVVAVAAIGVSAGAPNTWVIVLLAAIGAAIGDNIAFFIGRRIGVRRFAWMRRPRVVRAVDRAAQGLERRAATLILTARYIPVGRIAVNMTAGATGFRWRTFWPLTLAAGACWSVYSVLIGILAGQWAHSQPLLAALVGIVIAVTLGVSVDLLLSARARRRVARIAHEQQGAVEPNERALVTKGL
ncbi:DedA family protein [Leifsonia sp. Root112D2]|uniref:DedA family protein n=1 Tax=Leifsonia sp. Root112D2 TaxID=1736426 RepID=UPI0006FA15EF|nr:DedA family protein [Leifsonia sp. Root112D2]KQV07426.1 hypothetical protein ASC63_09050 [Leifsonia sp. Root112D2]